LHAKSDGRFTTALEATEVSSVPRSEHTAGNEIYPTLQALIEMSPEELEKVDPAIINLRCAEGLPGAKRIDFAATLKMIDEWTAKVKEQTELYFYLLQQNPDRFDGLEAKYKMDMMTTVLQQDIGLQYDPAMIALNGKEDTEFDTFSSDARNVFIVGLTTRKMGTCSSLPLLYHAICTRLGYPVNVMQSAGHYYLQWKDAKATFNIEATSRGGLMCHPDDFYWHWPKPVNFRYAEKYYLFKPLSRRDLLANGLKSRAEVLMAIHQYEMAILCQRSALDVTEHNKIGMQLVLDSMKAFYMKVVAWEAEQEVEKPTSQ
jgi:hypothetical protein